MKNRSGLKSVLVSAICVSLLASTLLGVPGANAELAVPTTGSSSAPAATEDQYCDSVCPSIANSNGQLLGLNGQAGWSSSDDQWCANHNSQTSPSVMASPAPLGATVPTQSCSTSYYPGDTSCGQVTAGFNRCQYKNTQVESYCQAYESAKMANAGEEMVLLLDIAATGVCGAACTMEMTGLGVGGPAQTAMKYCNYAAMGAGAAEILVTLTQQSSAMGKIADAALGAAGIVMGLKGMKGLGAGGKLSCDADHPKNSLFAYLDSLPSFIPTANATTPGITVTTNPDGTTTTAIINNDGTGSSFTQAPLQTSGESGSSVTSTSPSNPNNSSCKKEACITAVALAALTGIRYYNDGYGKRTKQSSCNSIWGLQSSANAVAGGITAAGFTASGGSVAGTSGSSLGTTGTSTGTTTAAGLNCVANGGTVASCSNGQVSAATGGGILGNSGLATLAAPLAQQLANAGALQGSGSGGLGGAMGGAMGGAGDMGPALTKVAQTAFDNGKELGQVASLGGYSSAGGGGGGTASDTNGLAGLFANSGPAGPATAPMAVFKGDGEDGDDIWHSHTSNNIFQIISHRIGKVNP